MTLPDYNNLSLMYTVCVCTLLMYHFTNSNYLSFSQSAVKVDDSNFLTQPAGITCPKEIENPCKATQ